MMRAHGNARGGGGVGSDVNGGRRAWLLVLHRFSRLSALAGDLPCVWGESYMHQFKHFAQPARQRVAGMCLAGRTAADNVSG